LNRENLSDFVIVNHIGYTLGFELAQFHKQVHTSIMLCDILEVSIWWENFTLKDDHRNYETVKTLEYEGLRIEYEMRTTVSNFTLLIESLAINIVIIRQISKIIRLISIIMLVSSSEGPHLSEAKFS
jgi:hypothetical protein